MTAMRATVRLQLNAGFTLDDARAQLDYFAQLGVSHLYLSPVFAATPGSTHGYDTCDFRRVNEEIGGEAALVALAQAAHDRGLGLVIDIVPNHMATNAMHNAWWRDVLQHGRSSPFATTFDIDWESPAHDGKILLPILGDPLGQVLIAGQLRLHFDERSGELDLAYHDYHLPLSPQSQQRLIDEVGSRGIDALLAEYAPPSIDSEGSGDGANDGNDSIDDSDERERISARLLELLDEQNYRLAWWRTAADELNWRRFFEVSDLIGLKVEREDVFEAVHSLTFSLYRQGVIDGVRVDHVDGLADPAAYCRMLRQRLEAIHPHRPAARQQGKPWIVVEKILGEGEPLPADWRVDGTTGYEFMNDVLRVLHDPGGLAPLNQLWERTSGRPADFDAEQREARRQLLTENLVSEFQALKRRLHDLAQDDPISRDISAPMIERALGALLEHFPVYRLYVTQPGRPSAQDAATFARALAGARRTLRSADQMALRWLRRWLGLSSRPWPDEAHQRAAIIKFQQLTTSLAAKAVEDTAFYRFHRLLSLNEVGGNPDVFCLTSDDFHQRMLQAGQATPLRLVATATHDHKRGEDVRARLAVISEVAPAWAEALQHWRSEAWSQAQARLRMAAGDGTTASAISAPADSSDASATPTQRPSAVDELSLIQMLVGAWPMTLQPDDEAGMNAYFERLAGWQGKALREAKHHTDWAAPDEQYEQLCRDYLFALLKPPPMGVSLLTRIHEFTRSLMAAGAANSLSQTLLRLTVPGIPDLYQGCEFWDFSLVDPDNRRPVDYPRAQQALTAGESMASLLPHWHDGRIKQALVHAALSCRKALPRLFEEGAYRPLSVQGRLADRVIAFVRDDGKQVALVIAPRWVWPLLDGQRPHVAPEAWADTTITLDATLQGLQWTDALNAATLTLDHEPAIGQLLARLPVALLTATR